MMQLVPGEKIDHLTIIGPSTKKYGTRKRFILCECDCGNKTDKRIEGLKNPSVNYKTCGKAGCKYNSTKNLDQDLSVFEPRKNHVREPNSKEALHIALSTPWR